MVSSSVSCVKADVSVFYRMWRNITVTTILMLLTGVEAQHSVSLSSQSLCAVNGSTVKISCTFTKPDHSSVTQREWYRVQGSEGEPQDLSKDPQYSGRVSVSTWWSDCELTVKNVSVSDSGVYNFRFKTQSSDWISASSAVHLTVTDLQVKVDPNTVGRRQVKVICSSTCDIRPHLYYWYRNGDYIRYTKDSSIVLNSFSVDDEGSYSCRVYESLYHSPPVCVLGKQCWGVTYTPEHVCVLKGTSVHISCSYKHPAGLTVIKSLWFIKEQRGTDPEPVDVREDVEYQGRVQYTQNSQNNCSLTITNLTEKDTREYRFKFYTDKDKYTTKAGVSLSVTDLKVTVSDWRDQNKKLSCITTCPLSNNPTYIWYKNGQSVNNQNRNELNVSSGDGGSYSCTVRGHEDMRRSPAVYSPRNTRAVVLSSGDTVEGGSVTLSCSSDANPPVHTYSWFKQRAAADTPLTTGQNYSISNISSQHIGLYYCTAHNLLGQHNSTPTLLDVFRYNSDGSEENTMLKFIMVGLVVFLTLTLLSGALWMWKRKSNKSNGQSSTGESRQLYSDATYETVPALDLSRRDATDDQDNVHYASVVFKNSHTQEVSLSSRVPPDTTEEDDVQYAALNVSRNTAATELVRHEAAEDSSQIYSNIKKVQRNTMS